VSLLAAWVLFPLILLALCVGMGLVVDLLCGRRLPGTLLAPIGLAAIVVLGEFTTWNGSLAQFTVPATLFGAVAGAGLSLPWRFGRPDPLVVLVAVAVFVIFGTPVIASGEPTFAGYVKLDDTATWLALTDRIMEHGRSLSGLGPSSYRATLEFNLAGGYPIGAFIPFGAAQKLSGGDLAWVFQPYESFLAAMLSLSLWEVLRTVRRRSFRAGAAFIAAQPALLYGYAMWGGVKELGATALLALAAVLAPAVVRHDTSLRDLFPLALAAAALVAVLSPGGIVWLCPMLAILTAVGWRRFDSRTALTRAALFAALLILLSLPALASGIVPPTSRPLVGSGGEGNLRGPLSPLQALGVWPAGDFRFHPDATVLTAVLLALAIAASLAGLWIAWRRGAAAPLLYASALVSLALILLLGSPWAAGKALATASPIALSLAMLGALWALRVDRVAGGVLLAAILGGVLWSNVLAYGGVNLAPYGLLHELEQIGKRYAGQGPTLMTEYDPYGARHFLRDAEGEGASELRMRSIPLRTGGEVEKGDAVDTDQLDLAGLFAYRTLILRRSPLASRPPLPYRLVQDGDYYEVWQRPEGETEPPAVLMPLGNGPEPAAMPECSQVRALAVRAAASGATRLAAARHAPFYDATRDPFIVPRPGHYTAWLEGSIRGAVALYVDRRKVGEVRQRIENQGGFIELGTAALSRGRHRARLRFGGADLHPGSGGFPRPLVGPLLFAPADDVSGGLISVPLSEPSRLCGRPWDWIEAVDQ
jgi:hypothetical protein